MKWPRDSLQPGSRSPDRSVEGHRRPARSADRWRIGAAGLVAALALGGCATEYDLTLTAHDSTTPIYGTAHDLGAGEARVSIVVGDQVYKGTWVQVTSERSISFVGASSWGWSGWGPFGDVARSQGDPVAKALLQAPDGTGMRCDFYGLTGGQGSGKCIDDKGLVFDVQIRSRTFK